MEQTCKISGLRFQALLNRNKRARGKKHKRNFLGIYSDPTIIFDILGEEAAVEYISNCTMAIEMTRAYNGELL